MEKHVEAILDSSEEGKYLIKWRHLAHRHDTWETANAVLNAPGGKRRLDSYRRQRQAEENDTEEERERLGLLLEQWTSVERVISHCKWEGEDWYLCKWLNLPYGDCTWEPSSYLLPEYQPVVDSFLVRSNVGGFQPSSLRLRESVKFKRLPKGPNYLKGQLRDYQLEGLNWLLYSWSEGNSVILADEMGLGKTIQTVAFLASLKCELTFSGPSLVVVPLSTIEAWRREFGRWSAGILNVLIYAGDAKSRAVQRQYEWGTAEKPCFNVLVTSYEMILKDRDILAAYPWRLLAIDEGHRLKNTGAQLHQVLNEVVRKRAFRMLITGTPLQNSLQELWALLRFILPDDYESFELFCNSYSLECGPEEAHKRLANLHAILKPHLLRRMKRDVEASLPAKTERILRVDLTAEQRDLYRMVLTRNYRELAMRQSGKSVGSLNNILMELKKVCNHPNLLLSHAAEDDALDFMSAGKMILLDKLLRRLHQDGHRVLIFSQMVRMLDILSLYLNSRGWIHQRLDGSTPAEQRRRAIDSFNAVGSKDFCFLLSTRAGGLGINLETADTVIIYDSDWNPQNDLQAMARAHRIGQTKLVSIFRLISKDTVEESILERAKQKMVLDHLVIQRFQQQNASPANALDRSELQRILQFGAQNIFHQQATQQPAELDLDEILARATEVENSSSHNAAEPVDDFLGQFRVADYAAVAPEPETKGVDWDEIIPTEERSRMEREEQDAEEKRKELALQEALLTAASGRRRRKHSESEEGVPKPNKLPKKDQKVTIGLELTLDRSVTRILHANLLRWGLERPDRWGGIEGLEGEVLRREADAIAKVARESTNKGETFSNGLYISCTQLRDRLVCLGQLYQIMHSHVDSLVSFRIHDPRVKSVALDGKNRWTIPWTIIHDAQLLVAFWQHGYAAWEEILADPAHAELKSVLDQRSDPKVDLPQNLHLERRVEYLCAILSREAEPHARKKVKKERIPYERTPRTSASAQARQTTLKFETIKKGLSGRTCKSFFKPIRDAILLLDALDAGEAAKVDQLRTAVCLIGDHIEAHVGEVDEGDRGDRTDEQVKLALWSWIVQFWPTNAVDGAEIQRLYEKIKQETQ